jgi:hypothetical protein
MHSVDHTNSNDIYDYIWLNIVDAGVLRYKLSLTLHKTQNTDDTYTTLC